MTRKELYRWLNDSCPTHDWKVKKNKNGYVKISFPVEETKETEKAEMETTNV